LKNARRQDAGIAFWGTLPALPVGGVQRQDGAEHRLKHSKKSLRDFRDLRRQEIASQPVVYEPAAALG
jgi:hypothetical protein